MGYECQACVDLQNPLRVPYPLRDLTLLHGKKTWVPGGKQQNTRARKKSAPMEFVI